MDQQCPLMIPWKRATACRCHFNGWSAKVLVLLLKYMVSLGAFNTASFRCFVLKATTCMDSTQSRNKPFLAVEIVPSDFQSVKGFEMVTEVSHSFFYTPHPVWRDAYLCVQPVMGGRALEPCFAVLFERPLPPSPLSFLISNFPTFSILAYFLLSLRSLCPSWAPPCCSNLDLPSPHLHICHLKIRPGPSSSGCGMTWQSSPRFVPLLAFPVGGDCCSGCAWVRKLTARISVSGNGLNMTLETHGCNV